MAAYRALAAQLRRALPANVPKISAMRSIGSSPPCRHLLFADDQQNINKCNTVARHLTLDYSQSRKQVVSVAVTSSAVRQAAQMHSSSSSRRRKGLQSRPQDAKLSQNGTNAGQSLPSSSNGAVKRVDQPSGRYSPSKPGDPDTSQSSNSSKQYDGPSRPSQPPCIARELSQNSTLGKQPAGPSRSPQSQFMDSGMSQNSTSSTRPAGAGMRAQPSFMPPHLFTAKWRGLQQSNREYEGGPPPGSRVLDVSGSKPAAEHLKAKLPPSELGGFEEKAEGVIQIGTSGLRIPLYGKSMQSIKEAIQREAAGTSFEHRPVVLEDSPDIAESQIDRRLKAKSFDWSGKTNYTEANRKTLQQRANWLACKTTGSTDKVLMTLPEGDAVSVLPLWIAVHQSLEGGLARLHDSNVPLSEEVVDELEAELEPFCYTAGLKFEGSDEKTGHWRNFFIGVVGDVDAQEEDNLWPNMVIHERRTLFNCRNAWDIAKFLADATPEDVDLHLFNLRRIQEERRYRSGWCYHHLRTRWGEEALRDFGISVNE